METEFAKKEEVIVPQDIWDEVNVKIPPLYYWEDVFEGKSQLMTMAFTHRGGYYGYSYPNEDENMVMRQILRKRLFNRMSETMDVVLHHGEKVMDRDGNIDPRLVNDQEAIRAFYDKNWKYKVAAFRKLIKINPITKKQAKQLKLI